MLQEIRVNRSPGSTSTPDDHWMVALSRLDDKRLVVACYKPDAGTGVLRRDVYIDAAYYWTNTVVAEQASWRSIRRHEVITTQNGVEWDELGGGILRLLSVNGGNNTLIVRYDCSGEILNLRTIRFRDNFLANTQLADGIGVNEPTKDKIMATTTTKNIEAGQVWDMPPKGAMGYSHDSPIRLVVKSVVDDTVNYTAVWVGHAAFPMRHDVDKLATFRRAVRLIDANEHPALDAHVGRTYGTDTPCKFMLKPAKAKTKEASIKVGDVLQIKTGYTMECTNGYVWSPDDANRFVVTKTEKDYLHGRFYWRSVTHCDVNDDSGNPLRVTRAIAASSLEPVTKPDKLDEFVKTKEAEFADKPRDFKIGDVMSVKSGTPVGTLTAQDANAVIVTDVVGSNVSVMYLDTCRHVPVNAVIPATELGKSVVPLTSNSRVNYAMRGFTDKLAAPTSINVGDTLEIKQGHVLGDRDGNTWVPIRGCRLIITSVCAGYAKFKMYYMTAGDSCILAPTGGNQVSFDELKLETTTELLPNKKLDAFVAEHEKEMADEALAAAQAKEAAKEIARNSKLALIKPGALFKIEHSTAVSLDGIAWSNAWCRANDLRFVVTSFDHDIVQVRAYYVSGCDLVSHSSNGTGISFSINEFVENVHYASSTPSQLELFIAKTEKELAWAVACRAGENICYVFGEIEYIFWGGSEGEGVMYVRVAKFCDADARVHKFRIDRASYADLKSRGLMGGLVAKIGCSRDVAYTVQPWDGSPDLGRAHLVVQRFFARLAAHQEVLLLVRLVGCCIRHLDGVRITCTAQVATTLLAGQVGEKLLQLNLAYL